jgi:hypothetical protein
MNDLFCFHGAITTTNSLIASTTSSTTLSTSSTSTSVGDRQK